MAKTATGADVPDLRMGGIASADAGQAAFTAAAQTTPWVELPEGSALFAAWAGPAGQSGGQVVLEMSVDGGATALNATLPSGADNLWTVPVVQRFLPTAERGVKYRLRCAALLTGSVAWRISA
jgi:hypothetical protein